MSGTIMPIDSPVVDITVHYNLQPAVMRECSDQSPQAAWNLVNVQPAWGWCVVHVETEKRKRKNKILLIIEQLSLFWWDSSCSLPNAIKICIKVRLCITNKTTHTRTRNQKIYSLFCNERIIKRMKHRQRTYFYIVLYRPISNVYNKIIYHKNISKCTRRYNSIKKCYKM